MASVRHARAPESFLTERLRLRRPERTDARAIFDRYASDAEVTRYLAWPRHRSIADTKAFLSFAEHEWTHGGVGPYLIESRSTDVLLGSTGLELEEDGVASTGYVLAADSWGRGYATEALRAMVEIAVGLGISTIHACVHPDHRASMRVLEKAGFERTSSCKEFCFPNLTPDTYVDAYEYRLRLEP